MYERNLEIMSLIRGDVDIERIRQMFYKKSEKQIYALGEFPEKTALVLVGTSASGKTTFAKEYVSRNKNWDYLSMDECYEQVCNEGKTSLEEADQKMIKEFDRRLAKHKEAKKSILVDGEWIDIRTRAALLKTLSDYGYRICMILMNPSAETMSKNLRKRALFATAQKVAVSYAKENGIPKDVMFMANNPLEYLSRELKIDTEYLQSWITTSPAFQIEEEMHFNIMESEASQIQIQFRDGIMTWGVDTYFIYHF